MTRSTARRSTALRSGRSTRHGSSTGSSPVSTERVTSLTGCVRIGAGRYCHWVAGCGAAWLARRSGGPKVGGSNPLSPTNVMSSRHRNLVNLRGAGFFRVGFGVGSRGLGSRVRCRRSSPVWVAMTLMSRSATVGFFVGGFNRSLLRQLGGWRWLR